MLKLNQKLTWISKQHLRMTGLTAAPVNLIFDMHTHIICSCVIGYMILTFDVIKGHFRSNKFLCQVPVDGGPASAGVPCGKRQRARDFLI